MSLRKPWIRFHDVAAAAAGALGFAAVKLFEVGNEVLFDVVQLEVGGVQGVVAGFAEPK